jgi:sarcosine oxidase subunit delta
MGSQEYASRPDDHAWSEAWDQYLHLRTNYAGHTHDLWHHEAGCGAWLLVGRDTATHEVVGASLASGARA